MKKPRTEITNERAKFLLSAYRHNGADAQDPTFREALEQAARDPQLANWFADQRIFDAIVTEKLSSIQPPPSLKPAILSGIYSGAQKKPFPVRQVLALAAVLAVSVVLLSLMFPKVDRGSFAQYQNAAMAVLSEGPAPKLDLVSSDLSQTQEYLSRQAAPCAPQVPAQLLKLPIVGCKAIDWNGMMISLTCFSLPSGELVHLFVADAKSMPNIPEGLRTINGWHVQMRREDGMLLMLISKAPMSELSQYI
jgi:hypothetical protein